MDVISQSEIPSPGVTGIIVDGPSGDQSSPTPPEQADAGARSVPAGPEPRAEQGPAASASQLAQETGAARDADSSPEAPAARIRRTHPESRSRGDLASALSLPYLSRVVVTALTRGPWAYVIALSGIAGILATRDFVKHSAVPGGSVDTSVIAAALFVMIGTTLTLAQIPPLVRTVLVAMKGSFRQGITQQVACAAAEPKEEPCQPSTNQSASASAASTLPASPAASPQQPGNRAERARAVAKSARSCRDKAHRECGPQKRRKRNRRR